MHDGDIRENRYENEKQENQCLYRTLCPKRKQLHNKDNRTPYSERVDIFPPTVRQGNIRGGVQV